MSRFCSFLLLCFLLSSCAGSPAWQSMQISSTRKVAERNNKKMLLLHVGQTKSEVMEIMGNPAKTESYDLGQKVVVEFHFYRTQGWSKYQTQDTDGQYTPLAFRNDKLVGWGRNYYNKVIRQQIDIKISDAQLGSLPRFDPSDVKEVF